MTIKRCGRCRRERERSAFDRRTASPDGLQSWCRECRNDYRRERYVPKLPPRPATPAGSKWCRRCDEVKPLAAFGPHGGTADGKQTYCTACFADLYRKKRAAEGLVSRPAGIPAGHKFCRSCQQVRPVQDFAARARAKDGRHYMCRRCATAADRARHLTRAYGLTVEDTLALSTRQQSSCAICGTPDPAQVDHDHGTGAVRGLLCFRCNAGLGLFRDEPAFLRSAAAYVDGWTHQHDADAYLDQRATRADTPVAS